MSIFADSSALVKLYADEEGCETVRSWSDLVVSHLARVEVAAAIWRKQRMFDLAPDAAATLVADFEADWFGDGSTQSRFAVVAVTGDVLDDAARLARVHGLRAYDAVQLASALLASAADPDLTAFAAYDVALRAAATAEGLALAG